MIDTPAHNPQAFPTLESNGERLILTDPGMTLRDYFAGQALEGIEASQGNSGHFVSTAEKVAARAYELAGAMLRERMKQ